MRLTFFLIFRCARVLWSGAGGPAPGKQGRHNLVRTPLGLNALLAGGPLSRSQLLYLGSIYKFRTVMSGLRKPVEISQDHSLAAAIGNSTEDRLLSDGTESSCKLFSTIMRVNSHLIKLRNSFIDHVLEIKSS